MTNYNELYWWVRLLAWIAEAVANRGINHEASMENGVDKLWKIYQIGGSI
ncbi:MAG: hypothetical protein HFH22_10230 [Ruminococcus sp.]|nr:hypothetical protein [Ruminococcus sp.]